MNPIVYQIFRTVFITSLRNIKHWLINTPIHKYVNKIENWITFRIKIGSYLELLTPESRKVLGSTKRRIMKEKNGENPQQLEITDVVLVQCNIVNNQYNHDSRILCTFVSSKLFGQLLNDSFTNKPYWLRNISFIIFCFLILKHNFPIKTVQLEIEYKISLTLGIKD